jgi:hydroxymethylbilane synthase
MSSISNKIRIGTRTSKLALAQIEEIKFLLAEHIPLEQIEIIQITTSGDKIQNRNLADIGGKGLFIKELEEALTENKIDIAIHSAKDVPPILHQDTILAAFSKRLDARDCFISKKFDSLDNLPQGAIIGTSSARRKAILLRLRPDLKIVNFRGNVDTRLKKIENDEVDATILAACGLERLGKEQMRNAEQITCPKGYKTKKLIEKNVMLPAGGQGALAIQIRKNDKKISAIIEKINDEKSRICIKTERAFLRELGASCATPVAAHAWLENDRLNLKTLILDYDGSEIFATESQSKFDLEEGLKMAIAAAKKTKTEAAKLLERICKI